MEAEDTVLVGCEVICIGEQTTDLIACPLSAEEQEKCKEKRQYQAGIKEVDKTLQVSEQLACVELIEGVPVWIVIDWEKWRELNA